MCGDGVLDPGELCDDGNLEVADGCSFCGVDDSIVITGTAQGGSVHVTMGGVEYQIITSPGHSAEGVASNIAFIMSGHPDFETEAYGNVIYTTGPIESFWWTDPGLLLNGQSILSAPALGPFGHGALLVLLLAGGVLRLRRC